MRGDAVLHRRSRTLEACKACGKPLFVYASVKARGGGKYCSRICKIATQQIPKQSPIERLFAKVKVTAGGCWRWRGRIEDNGYGRFYCNGKVQWAHRASFTLLRGSIPDRTELDHTCRNRSCVNPAHLDPVPKIVNILRGESPMAQQARRTHCPKGHPLSGDNLVASMLKN